LRVLVRELVVREWLRLAMLGHDFLDTDHVERIRAARRGERHAPERHHISSAQTPARRELNLANHPKQKT